MMRAIRSCIFLIMLTCLQCWFAAEAKPSDQSISKHFVFCSREFFTGDEDAPGCKAWTEKEKTTILDLLQKARALCPTLVEKAYAAGALTLERETFVRHKDESAAQDRQNLIEFASAHPGFLSFADAFFAEEPERQLEIMLHELTHESDYLETIGYSAKWREYFLKHYQPEPSLAPESKNDWNIRPLGKDAPEGLAQTYPKYLLGEAIPDKEYFEKQIVPLLTSTSKVETAALRHYIAGREFYELKGDLPQAKRELLQAVRLMPNALRPRLMLIGIIYNLGDIPGALKQTDESLKIAEMTRLPPSEWYSVKLHSDRAIFLMNGAGNYSEAIRLLRMVRKDQPHDRQNQDLLIECLEKQASFEHLGHRLTLPKTEK